MSESQGRRVLSVASGTIASRLTGLLRVLVLAWVLGFTPLADAFNLANTIPNMLFDLVVGGVLSATFIPVVVERLTIDGERRAWRSISTIVTAALIALVVACVAAWIGARWIIEGFTFLQHPRGVTALVALQRQRAIAISLLRWFIPQIFFYGVIGLASALLNIRQRFAIGAWAPVANNFVCIGVLVWFHLVDPNPVISNLSSSSELMWLGLGTTAGVAVQFIIMGPSLARSQLGRLRLHLDVADPVLRRVGRLGGWTFLMVISNQISLYVVLALAFATGGAGPVSAYTYGWSFMQMPYAVVAVSVMAVITPKLAELAAVHDFTGVGERLAIGLRQSLVIILPATVTLVILAQPLVAILLNHVNATRRIPAGTVLAILAAGLPGFTVFQLSVRGLQSLQRARDVFLLYVVENATNIALALWWGHHSLAGVTASVTVAYSASALLAVAVLGFRGVAIAPAMVSPPVRRSFTAALVMGLVMAAAYATPTWSSGLGLIGRAALSVACGVVSYALVVELGQRRHRRPGNVTD